MDRKKTILCLLIIVFAATFAYRMMHPFEQKRVSALTYTGKKGHAPSKGGNAKKANGSGMKLDVMFNLYLDPPKHSGKTSRNIFIKKSSDRHQEKLGKEVETHALRRDLAIPQRGNLREKLNRELSRFRVFGAYQSKNDKILFLERGKEILLIRKGDRIDGKYLVKEITDRSIVLRAEEIGEDIHIDLSDF